MDDEKDIKKEFDEMEFENYEDEKKRRHPPFILLIILTTFAVLVALGLSFSAINYMESSETINTIISSLKGDDSDKYIITYVEGIVNADNSLTTTENGIYLVNQFPISDDKGKLFDGEDYVYNFSLLIGKKTKGMYYELTAVPNQNNTLDSRFVKLYLEKDGQGVDLSYRANGQVKTFNEYKRSEYNETKGLVIYNGYITEEEAMAGKITFKMRMWISEDTKIDNNNSNKTFMVKVNTYARHNK